MNDIPLYSDITENELAFINKNKPNNVIIKMNGFDIILNTKLVHK